MEFLDVLKSIFSTFLMVAWIWVLVIVISDVFRSSDLGGLGKGFWMIFLILVPWIGVLSYIIIRGGGMHERSEQAHMLNKSLVKYIFVPGGATLGESLQAALAELDQQGGERYMLEIYNLFGDPAIVPWSD